MVMVIVKSEKRGRDTQIFEIRGMDKDMGMACNRCLPNSDVHLPVQPYTLYVERKLLVTSSMKQWPISFQTAHLVLIAWAKNKMVMNSILKKVVSKIEFKISVE